jgi:hypothetical protein
MMIKHLNQAAQECGIDTHTHLKAELREWILYSQGETERLNCPKSVVSPFDEIRRVGKASGIES